MNRTAVSQASDPTAEPAGAKSADADADAGEPRLAVTLRFHLGELTATAEAVTAAHDAGVRVIEALLRHLSGDWGDIDGDAWAANDNAVATGGCLRSLYALPGGRDALVVTPDADRRHTTAALESQPEPGR